MLLLLKRFEKIVALGPFANGVGELKAPQGPNTYRALLERKAMFGAWLTLS